MNLETQRHLAVEANRGTSSGPSYDLARERKIFQAPDQQPIREFASPVL